MNPYAAPTIEQLHASQPKKLSLRNPARFLLYPLALLCVGFSLLMAWQYVQTGFDYRKKAEYLNAGAGFAGRDLWDLCVFSCSSTANKEH